YGNNFFADAVLVGDSKGTNFLLYENENGTYQLLDQKDNPFSLQFLFPGQDFIFGYGAQVTMKVADVDGDQDDDVFLWYNNGFASIFENTGNSFEFKFSNFPQLHSFVQYADFGDLDLDGDVDVLVGSQSGRIQILENLQDTVVISNHYGLPSNIFEGGETQLVVPIPGLVDIDNDQDLDLFTVANTTLGTLFFENTGVANLMAFEDNTRLQARDTILLGDSAVTYTESKTLSFQNMGNIPLNVELRDVPEFVTLSTTSFLVEPGDTLAVNLTLNEIGKSEPEFYDSLYIASNDVSDSLWVLNLATRVNNVAVVGLEPNELLSQLYPNPNEGTLFLTLEESNQEVLIEVVDLSGKSLFRQQLTYQQEVLRIELPPYQPGLYIMRVKSGNGRVTSRTVFLK
ncbi:MAG: T9SS type A sorting domain-containing protein, partial [Bacteroidota bacterium]